MGVQTGPGVLLLNPGPLRRFPSPDPGRLQNFLGSPLSPTRDHGVRYGSRVDLRPHPRVHVCACVCVGCGVSLRPHPRVWVVCRCNHNHACTYACVCVRCSVVWRVVRNRYGHWTRRECRVRRTCQGSSGVDSQTTTTKRLRSRGGSTTRGPSTPGDSRLRTRLTPGISLLRSSQSHRIHV